MKSKANNSVMYALSFLILTLAVIAYFVPEVSIGIPIVIVVSLLFLLFRSEYFSNHVKGSKRQKTYVYLIALSLLGIVAVYLIKYLDLGKGVKYSPTLLMMTIFVFVFGNLAPKIPFNRTLGLRLPWTVSHEPTWRYAHRIVGYCTFPTIVLLVIALFANLEILYGITILIWVLVPAIMSFIYYRNWMKGNITE